MARKHDIRRAILLALSRPGPPLTLDRLQNSLDAQTAGAAREEIMDALPGVIEHGYVRNHLAGKGGWLLALTAAARDQINRDADMDEYVWGEYAYTGQ